MHEFKIAIAIDARRAERQSRRVARWLMWLHFKHRIRSLWRYLF
jgi:hypothetical protein